MAISDMLSTIFAIPTMLAIEISPNYWPLGVFMCGGTRVISTISVSVSVYTMVALALERYQAIVNPFRVRASRKTYRKTLIVMVIIWLVSCGIAAPQVFVVTITDIPPFKYCVEDWTNHGGMKGNRIYTVVAFVVLFAIPIVVICVSYIVIIRTLWHPEPVLGEDESGSPTNEGNTSRSIYTIHRAKKRRKDNLHASNSDCRILNLYATVFR
ncbi:hypothetical protein OS493_001102 [Desmophyllum pertusum]|uniref:G-protein coupled receptors family 1 profile domain-containing protein n=1 Tax=Desmophyllum pertusum TaxID=174260 RepID=A0A9W9ZXE1_9CNID|nr:hypothetical protein OS493_001102 [Desmophyllum pertusum]